MGPTVKEIISVMEDIAPTILAEEWDNVGLLAGNENSRVRKLMVVLDVTKDVINEAVKAHVDLIISHHPLIFNPLKRIDSNSPDGEIIHLLIKNDISLFAAHTNLDKAAGGVDDSLAQELGLQDIRPLTFDDKQAYYKLTVFVPQGHEGRVISAIAESGGGFIGKYSHCTFRAKGIGTFLPLEGTNPYIGRQGQLEQVEEFRIETVVPSTSLDKIVKSMEKAHPYEEIAYDLYPLVNGYKIPGFGRIGKISPVQSLKDFAKMIQARLSSDRLDIVGDMDREIQIVASCAGAGGQLIESAQKAGADVFVTGEIKYHDAQKAAALGIALVSAGHYHTEMPAVKSLINRLQKTFDDLQYNIELVPSHTQKAPFNKITGL